MSKLPQLNLRIPDQHHQLIRDIAHILRESHGDAFAADLTQWLSGRPQPGATDPDLAARVADLEARVKGLENLALRDTAPAVVPAKLNAPYPDDMLVLADELNRQGMTWEAVWKHLGEPGTVNGLRNAVGKRRKRQEA